MTTPNKPASRALAWAASVPWCIQRQALDQILAIAAREHEPNIEAVLARQGEPLAKAPNVQMRGETAVLPVRGPIFRHATLFTEISGATSIEQLALDFRTALESPKVRAIVLAIDSPGGAVSGISEFAKQVRAANSAKPVIAYVDGLAASGGYWIASAAPWVATSDTGLLGSIGVVASLRLADDKSLVEIVSSQSPQKRPDVRTDAGRAVVQRNVDELAEVFISAVASYRQTSVAAVLRDFGAGGVLIGRKAVDAGMADQVSTLETVLEDIQRDGHPAARDSRERLAAADRATTGSKR